VTDIKFDSKVLTDVADSERTEPGPEEDKDPSVKIRIVSVEVAGGAVAEERLREAQQSLYVARTSGGTLDEAAGEHRASDILRDGSGLLV
jgi:hypothetical protein